MLTTPHTGGCSPHRRRRRIERAVQEKSGAVLLRNQVLLTLPRMRKILTDRQADVLGVVDTQGPVSAGRVGEYHLPVGAAAARSALAALERKQFVQAVYTGRGTERGRAYVITAEGSEALARFDAGREPG